MSLVILDAFTQENAIEKAPKTLLEKTGREVFLFQN